MRSHVACSAGKRTSVAAVTPVASTIAMSPLIGLIPARGGSKGIPRKNLAPCAGKSLLAWTAEAALGSRVFDHVILSTDDAEIAEAGRLLGLEVPFLRPAALSGDGAPMHGVVSHAIAAVREGGCRPETVVLLQPTSPLRRARHIVEAVDLFRRTGAATVVSVTRVPHRFVPSSLMRECDGQLVPFQGTNFGPTQRQDKEILFARNGPAVLVMRSDVIDAGKLYGDPTLGYEMDEIVSLDVDTPNDLRLADLLIADLLSNGEWA
jgi:CMP-N,N'-diacetyllegionaminic acid synthase